MFDSGNAGPYLGIVLFILTVSVIVALFSYVVYSFLMSFVFKKAGVTVWKAWVPGYNMWIFSELAGYKGWYYLALMIVPSAVSIIIPMIGGVVSFPLAVAALVGSIFVMLNFQKAFSKDGVFVLLAIFLPLIWLGIIAFDGSVYDRSKLERGVPSFASL